VKYPDSDGARGGGVDKPRPFAHLGAVASVWRRGSGALRLAGAIGALVVPLAACNTLLGNQPGYLVAPDALADDAGPAPWTPASLGTDLVLWLVGDRGVETASCATGTCVTRWSDQSGNGNDAQVPAPFAPPLHRRDAGLYGGHAALGFDGAQTALIVRDAQSLELTWDYTIIAVAAVRASSTQNEGGLYSKTALGSPYAGPALWGSYVNGSVPHLPAGVAGAQVDIFQFVVSRETGLDDGRLRVYATVFDGQTLTVRVDDGAPTIGQVVAARGTLAAPGTSSWVGGNAPGQILNGDIAELMVVSRAIDETTWAQAWGYLSNRYAL
jgi:hypothetical protein